MTNVLNIMELVVLYLRTKHPESPASTKINACITHAFCDVFCCVLVLVMGLVLLAALATIRPWLIGACGACAIIWGPSSHPVLIYVALPGGYENYESLRPSDSSPNPTPGRCYQTHQIWLEPLFLHPLLKLVLALLCACFTCCVLAQTCPWLD